MEELLEAADDHDALARRLRARGFERLGLRGRQLELVQVEEVADFGRVHKNAQLLEEALHVGHAQMLRAAPDELEERVEALAVVVGDGEAIVLRRGDDAQGERLAVLLEQVDQRRPPAA